MAIRKSDDRSNETDSRYNETNFFNKVSELDFLREFNRDMYKLLNNYFKDDDYIKNIYYTQPAAPQQQRLHELFYSEIINGISYNKQKLINKIY